MKSVIINADDFGLNKNINRGVIKVFREGLLTSASLIVNMPGFEDAVSLIRENPGLDIGIHINIIRGKPILPCAKLGSLTEGEYFLGGVSKILRMIYLKRQGLEEIEKECRAQIEKLLQRGVTITHLDSEKHIHMVKPIFKTIARIASEYKISNIRVANEMPYLYQNMFNLPLIIKKQFYKSLLLSIISMQNRAMIQQYNIKTADYFYSIINADDNKITYAYQRAFYNLRDGITEILCHPGYHVDSELQEYSFCFGKFHINREKELNALLDPALKDLINKLNIRLISFRDV